MYLLGRMLAWIVGVALLAGCSHGPREVKAPAPAESYAGWQHWTLPGKTATDYRPVRYGGTRDAMEVQARSSASLLRRPLNLAPQDFGDIRFSWKVPALIPGTDMARRETEDAVVRILDKQAMVRQRGALRLDALGFAPATVAALRGLLDCAHGMLLVTGPTGSGKTTTLYAALSETNTGRHKIVTIEDPVEYQLPGVLQIPVHEKKGLTFARGLRSILRHDPDTIMVGEIRDRETAEIAVQSALTGHLVLTTVHANNVFDVFGRFTHMGLDAYALVSALNGVWAQRLLRMNCPHCSRPVAPEPGALARIGLSAHDLAGADVRQGTGCGECRGTGYRGRQAVAEVLRLDDELREMIVARRPVRGVKAHARATGTRSLYDAALDLARQGLTTLEEVRRVTLAA